jgi:hypothetical protein
MTPSFTNVINVWLVCTLPFSFGHCGPSSASLQYLTVCASCVDRAIIVFLLDAHQLQFLFIETLTCTYLEHIHVFLPFIGLYISSCFFFLIYETGMSGVKF